MGHTLPTITAHFERFLADLSKYRRALRKSDQRVFDKMIKKVRQHLPAAGYAANVLPDISFMLSLHLEEEKKLENHDGEFQKLRQELHAELAKLRKQIAEAEDEHSN